MARTKTTNQHSKVRSSSRCTIFASTFSPAISPPIAPLPVGVQVTPFQSPLATSEAHPFSATSTPSSNPSIPQTVPHVLCTEATSMGESDEGTGSHGGTGSQPGSEFEEPPGESQHTEHIEELQKSGSNFAIEDEEEKESRDDEDNVYNDEHDASVRFTHAKLMNVRTLLIFLLNIRTLGRPPQISQLQQLTLSCSNKVCYTKLVLLS
ncbi:hypothetical protein Fot_37412 [Forsythia ovata]|uniref:Uncharacterized protein n=1 Tax=Forsythia ovata TaxID=205694 RepID=A0ABD1RYX7_9LAMI